MRATLAPAALALASVLVAHPGVSSTPTVVVAPGCPGTLAEATETAVVNLAVDANGSPATVETISGSEKAGQMAMAAARLWRFGLSDEGNRSVQLRFVFRGGPGPGREVPEDVRFVSPSGVEVTCGAQGSGVIVTARALQVRVCVCGKS